MLGFVEIPAAFTLLWHKEITEERTVITESAVNRLEASVSYALWMRSPRNSTRPLFLPAGCPTLKPDFILLTKPGWFNDWGEPNDSRDFDNLARYIVLDAEDASDAILKAVQSYLAMEDADYATLTRLINEAFANE